MVEAEAAEAVPAVEEDPVDRVDVLADDSFVVVRSVLSAWNMLRTSTTKRSIKFAVSFPRGPRSNPVVVPASVPSTNER